VRRRRQQLDDEALLEEYERALPIMTALALAQERPHEILDIALASADQEQAVARLRTRFGWSEVQAQAAIEMGFRSTTADRRERIAREVTFLTEQIAGLRAASAE
jgi:DNA gyrase subunit A